MEQWNRLQTHIDDKAIRAIHDTMVTSGMRDVGYQFVIIDDGWQRVRDANGVLSPFGGDCVPWHQPRL
jgi:alpha-galactosidase